MQISVNSVFVLHIMHNKRGEERSKEKLNPIVDAIGKKTSLTMKGMGNMKRGIKIITLLMTVFLILSISVSARTNAKPNYSKAVTTTTALESRLTTLIGKYKNTYWTSDGKSSDSDGTTSLYYYGIQCNGFAKLIFNDLFNCGSIGNYDSNKYYYPNTTVADLIGKSYNVSETDVTTVKNILSKGKKGDFIQVRRRGKSWGHSMILDKVDSKGIWIFDCNSDGHCKVQYYYQTWSTFASKNIGLSLYRAKNYPTIAVPDKPKITKMSAASTTEINITWGEAEGAKKYDLYAKLAGGTYTAIATDTTKTTFTHTGLQAGKRYWYYVVAKNDGGKNTSEHVACYTKNTAPTVTAQSNSIKITWSAPTQAVSYTVMRRRYDEDEYTDLKSGITAKQYEDKAVEPGYKYYYRVKALCTLDSDSWNCTTETGGAFSTMKAPGVSVLSQNAVKLTWNANKGNNTYKFIVQRKLLTDGDYTNVATVTETGYTDAGLEAGTAYRYRIKAVTTDNHFCTYSLESDVTTATGLNLGDDFKAYITYDVNGKHITAENGNAVLKGYNGDLNQIWRFVRQADSSYKIISEAYGDYNTLDVSGWGSEAGTNVGIYYDNDYVDGNSSSNQRWYITGTNGKYRLKPKCSECVLDVSGGGDAADGTNMQLWTYLDYGAQEFYINKVESFILDVNAIADGVYLYDTKGFATFDVYVNGELKEDDVTDAWISIPKGIRYEIADVKTSVGYSFEGVSAGETSGRIEKDTVLELVLSPNKYTVRYEPNGGSGEAYSSEHVYNKESNLTQNYFERGGYEFVGWNTLPYGDGREYEECETVKNLTDKQNGEIVLYAQWKKTAVSDKTEVMFETDGKTVEVKITNAPAKYRVFAVNYRDNVSEVKEIEIIDGKGKTEFSENCEKVKVFVWESLTSMKPIC